MLLVGLGFMIFIIFSTTVKHRINELENEEEYILLKDIAYSTQNEISIAARMQDGYYREFDIPYELENGRNYTINITNNYIFAASEDHDYMIEIPPVIGNIQKNTNRINKTNETIYLN
jgi:hypothetical protein